MIAAALELVDQAAIRRLRLYTVKSGSDDVGRCVALILRDTHQFGGIDCTRLERRHDLQSLKPGG